MSSTLTPRVAFFGATGGCTFTCLVHTLRAGIPSVALVRTPSKLTSLLNAQGLDESTLQSSLRIIQGNALDVEAVKQTLSAGPKGSVVDLIISGLGAAPSLSFNIRSPLQLFTLDDPHICENASKTLLSALGELSTESPSKPLVTFISTTGITRGPEDVPYWMRWLYHGMLAVPHLDKRAMEDQFRHQTEATEHPLVRNVIGIRPTLLAGTTDTKDGIGADKLRVGTESKPALGYTVKRADVGEWIFRNVVESNATRDRWAGEMVTLTS